MRVRDLMEMLAHVDQDAEVVLRCDEDLALDADDVRVGDGVVAFSAVDLVAAGYCDDCLELLAAL